MLMKQSFWFLLAACLLLASSALAAAPPSVDWDVLASGGGRLAQGAYRLDYTVGQPVTGPAAQDARSVCAGFWCAKATGPVPVPPTEGIFLPLVVRVAP